MKKSKTILPLQFTKLTLDSIANTPTPPPAAARALAIVHTCMYDAWACYHEVAHATRLRGTLRRPESDHTRENRREAIAYAAYRALLELFPSRKDQFIAKMDALEYAPDFKELDPSTPAGLGNLVAKSVLEYFAGDGSNQRNNIVGIDKPYADYTGFLPTVKPEDPTTDDNVGHWHPLPGQKCTLPHWGLLRTFALPYPSYCRPVRGPEQVGTQRFRQQAADLLELSAQLTTEHKAIAEYWMDGPGSVTPPGHWCLLAIEIATSRDLGLGKTIRLMFALTNALCDAGIAAWECKRFYDYARPVTVIRHLWRGKEITAWTENGPAKMNGEAWRPYQKKDFVTPPFQEFVSGHSTFSAAAAEVLKRFFDSDQFDYQAETTELAIDGRKLPVPVVLHWNTFSEAADQAGMSRRYGGIHFEDGDLKGREMGREIGALTWEKCRAIWAGVI